MPIAFSHHWGQTVKIQLTENITTLQCPKPKNDFKIRKEIVDNEEFQEEFIQEYTHWEFLKEKYNYNILEWWECIVKPGIKSIAIKHTKEENKK